ncbi:MAG TPA: FlgD immunoglobulin-like domain containing protein, partial [Candidatus Eisenbacteria bacterium]|nr:FlgD immunoglobulin-like domain containing protein [Candidatus Eisenbacteria bacterium]
YDLAGRERRVLAAAALPAGEHAIRWDGRDDRGARLPPGLYLVRLTTGAGQRAVRLTVLD